MPRAFYAQRSGVRRQRTAVNVVALINTVFTQETADAAHAQWRIVADQLREKFPKFASMMDGAEGEVLAFMDFPKAHHKQIASTNPLNGLTRRSSDEPTLSGYSPTTRRSSGSLARSYWSKTMNGSLFAAICNSKE
jgi:transposase-like protein